MNNTSSEVDRRQAAWPVRDRNDNTMMVEGWTTRYDGHGLMAGAATAASASPRHTLLFRGQKEIKYIDDIFLIGQKARPLYQASDRSRLERRLNTIATDRTWFGQLAGAYLGSKVGQGCKVAFGELMTQFDIRSPDERVLLAQLLLEALQYRNCQLAGREWRDYLFLLSATTNAERAAMYALQNNPKRAFVLEYAPPRGRNLARSVKDFKEEYAALGFGETFPDEDEEYMIRYAMLPHFLLGYTRLDRHGRATPFSYAATYVSNPAYASGAATLDNPPDLNDEQEDVMRRTLPHLAWVFNFEAGAISGWGQIRTPDGIEPLDPPMRTERLEQSTAGRTRPQ